MKKSKLLVPFAMLATLSSTCMITSCNNSSQPDPSESFTLTFRAGEHGQIIGQSELTVSAGLTWGEVNKPTAQPDNGYKIDGWYFNGKQLVNSDKISSNMDIEVRFIRKTDEDFVTLNFITDGNGVLEGETTIKIDKGLKWGDITPPEAINNAGYTFNGWYYNEHQMEDSDELSSDMTIQAKFIEKQPTSASSFEWELDSGSRTATIKNFIGDETEIIIPSEYTDNNTNLTYSVTTIKASAFSYYGCDKITLVRIPDSVTSIGANAFKDCTGLKSLNIGSGVTSLPDSTCFSGCTNIQDLSVYNGNALTHIPKNEVMTLSIKKGTVSGFNGCTKLNSILLGEEITTISASAFDGCTGLTEVTIPGSTTQIGNYAFNGCTGLTTIKIVNQKSDWRGDYIFGTSRNNITTLIVENGIIGYLSYSQWAGLTTAEIGSGVTKIEQTAFEGSTGLTSVTIGSGVTSIEYRTFNGCTGLTSVTIGSNVSSIGEDAFYECTSLTEIEIPDSVETIGEEAFSECTGLTTLDIGAGVYSIQSNSFYGCTGLESIKVSKSNSKYTSRDSLNNECNCIITKASHKLILGCKTSTIPNNVETIGEDAFHGCTGLESITIPNSVETIGEDAFHGCTGLESITIPDGVKSINDGAFAVCTGLTSIVIPDSVTNLGTYAFASCTGLTSVEIGSGVTSIGEHTFGSCSELTSVTIGSGVTSIDNTAFVGSSKIDSITILNQKEDWVLSNIFQSSKEKITTLTIENGTINNDPGFNSFSNLRSITIGSGVISILGSRFSRAHSLESIEIDKNNNYYTSQDSQGNECDCVIEKESTELIDGCKATVIPGGVTSIGTNAFIECIGLTEMEIPDSVETIGVQGFWGCTGLTSVTIGSGVTKIEDAAFAGCTDLTDISYNGTKSDFGSIAKGSFWNYNVPATVVHCIDGDYTI